MPSSLKEYIKQKLSENVPLAEIKEDLKKMGYDINEINKAVREVIGGRRIPVHTLQITVLIVGIIIAAGIGTYLTISGERGEPEETPTQPSSAPLIPFQSVVLTETGEPKIVQSLTPLNVTDACSQFNRTEGEIACMDAANTAVAYVKNYSDDIYSVRKDSIWLNRYNTSSEFGVWSFEIRFNETIIDANLFPGISKVGYVEIAIDRDTGEEFIIAYGPPW